MTLLYMAAVIFPDLPIGGLSLKSKHLLRSLVIVLSVVLLATLPGCGSDHDHESSESAQYPAQFTVISFPQSAAEIETETQVLLGQMEEGFQAIIDAEPQTFENCILPYDRLSYLGFRYFSVLSELLSVSPSPEVQAAAMAAIAQLAEYLTEIKLNQQLQEVLASFYPSIDDYSGEERELLQRVTTNPDMTAEESAQLQQSELLRVQTQSLFQQMVYYLTQGLDSESVAIFKQLLYTHTLLANIKGKQSAADYYITETMAATPEVAREFVQTISDQLDIPFTTLQEEMAALKQAATGDPAAQISATDFSTWQNAWIAEDYQFSNFRHFYYYGEMFPLENVMRALLTISERVFGIHLEQVPAPTSVWADNVSYYEATDAGTGDPVASLYLDIYDRDNKQEITQIAPIAGSYTQDGMRMRPVLLLQSNFGQPEADSQTLLSWDETRSLFHEFGHFLNMACETTSYYNTYVAKNADYLELMSQLLERWMGDPQVLEILQGDSPTLSADEMASFLQAKFFNALREEKFRVAGSMFGLRAYADYTAEEIADAAFDPLALYNQSLEEYYLSPMSESSIPTQMATYPATVYGYLWSEVVADDIASEFRQAEDGFMNRELGQRLKEIIYTNSYDYDATTDIERFLGRPWNTDAYLTPYTDML